MRWLRRLGRTIFRSPDDHDVRDELRLHEDMEAADLIRQGVPAPDARRQARLALGGSASLREDARDVRGLPWLANATRDVGYTLRSFRRAPGFTFVIVLTLALGIGANTTFFSILNALVLKPLPVRDPSSVVMMERHEWTYPIWEQVRDRQLEVFEGTFAWSPTPFDLSRGGQTDLVDGAYVSGDLLRVLGVGATRGRALTVADDQRGGGPDGAVAVISERLWHRRFGGSGDIVGQRLTLDRVTFTVVGVMPASFLGLNVGRAFDVMVPFALKPLVTGDPQALDHRANWGVNVGARLAPKYSIGEAQAALRLIQPAIRDATVPLGWSPQAAATFLSDPLTLERAPTGLSDVRARYQPALVVIMVVVGLVLLIACANVANLMLARATTRQRELSVRLALGATRRRIAAQLSIESLMLSVAGAIAGLIVALAASALVVRQLTTWRDTVVLDLTPDWRVFGFLVVVTASTAITFGLAPAWRVRASSPQEALRRSGRGVIGDRRFGVRNVLVVSQVALSLVLILAAGLFLRTFVTLSRVPTGMATGSLTVVSLNLQGSTVPAEARAGHIERLRQAVEAVPGVIASAASQVTPLSGAAWNTAVGPTFPPSRDQMTWMNGVSPGWFRTVGATLLEGRDFTASDVEGVAIVNEAFATRFLEADLPATGQSFRTSGPSGTGDVFTVIGLTSHVMYRTPREGVVPTAFVPDTGGQARTLFVRTAPGQDAPVQQAIAAALQRVDNQVAFAIRPFDTLVDATVSSERLTAGLAVAFGGLALLLAAVGLYGVMSYAVNRRRSEIAVRMALGADRAGISRLVVGHAGVLVASGVAVGAVASWWAAQFVQTLLFGLEARDVTTLAGAMAVLSLVGLAAAWIPARRASRIDPAGLLRDS